MTDSKTEIKIRSADSQAARNRTPRRLANPRIGVLVDFRIVMISALLLASFAASTKAQQTSPGFDTYVGYVSRLIGGNAWLRSGQTNPTIELAPQNARGHLIYSSSEICCMADAELRIQLRWGGGETNITSTNWVRLVPVNLFGAAHGVTNHSINVLPGNRRDRMRLEPAGGISQSPTTGEHFFAATNPTPPSPLQTLPDSYKIQAMRAHSATDIEEKILKFYQSRAYLEGNGEELNARMARRYFEEAANSTNASVEPTRPPGFYLDQMRIEVLDALNLPVPDYPLALAALDRASSYIRTYSFVISHFRLSSKNEAGSSEEQSDLPSDFEVSLEALQEMFDLAKNQITQMHRQGAINTLSDGQLLCAQIRKQSMFRHYQKSTP